MTISFVDLNAQDLTSKSKIDGAIADVIACFAFIRELQVEALTPTHA